LESNPDQRIADFGFAYSPYNACARVLHPPIPGQWAFRFPGPPVLWVLARPATIGDELFLVDALGPYSWPVLVEVYGAEWT